MDSVSDFWPSLRAVSNFIYLGTTTFETSKNRPGRVYFWELLKGMVHGRNTLNSL